MGLFGCHSYVTPCSAAVLIQDPDRFANKRSGFHLIISAIWNATSRLCSALSLGSQVV